MRGMANTIKPSVVLECMTLGIDNENIDMVIVKKAVSDLPPYTVSNTQPKEGYRITVEPRITIVIHHLVLGSSS
jgi:hypothetical protein